MQNKHHFIREQALKLGFTHVGFAKAAHMDEEAKRLESWLNSGHHGQMGYMENHFELRTDPRKLVPGAKSVISLLFNYHTDREQTDPQAPQISKYAYGKDYHKLIRKRLKRLLAVLQDEFGSVDGRGFVDSAPVLERDWAKRAGNGWIGKNTMLIHPKAGSYFFLAELITDFELEEDAPMKDYCGTCTKCIDACPTDAISPKGYVLDGSRCISYLTIELRDAIPREFSDKMENWMFGCDICQEVCPWNRFATPHKEPAFEPKEDLLKMDRREWMEITEELFDGLFEGSAVRRTKYEGLKRNLEFLSQSEGAD